MKQHIPVFDKDKAEEVGIKVRKLDTDFSMDEANHRHTYEELIWVKSGTGAQLIDNQTYPVTPNTLYLISKGQVHNFQEGKNMEAYVIVFDPNFLSTYSPLRFSIISKKLKQFTSISIQPPFIKQLDLLIQQMLREYQQPKSTIGRNETLSWFLMIFLTLIERSVDRTTPSNELLKPDYKFSIYQELLQLIESNYKREHQLSFYTQHLGISARNLTNYTKIYAGKTAKQLIIQRILSEAKRLLLFTSQSLKEVAMNLGFEETSYFIRVFRVHTQTTPQRFREEHQG